MSNTTHDLVFKLTTIDAWSEAIVSGAVLPSPDDRRDGYIHLSAAHQLEGTARKYFTGVEDLCLVAFAPADLDPGLVWEASRGGDRFPHFYGDIPASAALWVAPVPLDEQGVPLLPAVT